jgi:hypothetical protein
LEERGAAKSGASKSIHKAHRAHDTSEKKIITAARILGFIETRY